MTERPTGAIEDGLLAAVHALLQDWVRREDGALERFLSHFAPDVVVVGTGGDEVAVGLEELTAFMRREHDNTPLGFTYTLSGTHAQRLHDDAGFVHGNLTLQVPTDDAEVLSFGIRFTCVFRRAGGAWRVAHWHGSRPDTEQAAGESWPVDAVRARNQELERMVAERTASLREAQAQLVHQEKMASLGALTAGIAHEIKNPLNFVTNFAQLSRELVEELEAETDPEEREAILADLKRNAAKIEEHGKRADGIVRAMMQHARGGEGSREVVDLNALVGEYVDLAYHGKRAQAPDFVVELAQDLSREAGAVEIVPQEIGRVLLNLLGNAFDAVHARPAGRNGHRPPTVTVSTRRRENAAEIRVSDNGPGIPAAVKEKIFEPFFTTKPAGQGTGLGLSLSYDIVTQGHGGTLTVESEEGQGAAFIVVLPAARAAGPS